MSKTARVLVAGLTLSLAGFLTITDREFYVDEAMVPTKNDRPTLGFGSTFYEDGSPVKLGDKVKPVRALHLAAAHISKEEQRCRDSLQGVALSQPEYDIYCGDWTYQFGSGAWVKSKMRRDLLAGNYAAACEALLLYRFAGGYDCSTLIDGKPNKRCWGVWTRQLERHKKCLEAQ